MLGLEAVASPRVPPYFDALLAAFRCGRAGRHVHLGWWAEPPPPDWAAEPGAFARAQARLDTQLLALADLHDGQRVADIGCGLGGTLAAVDRRHSGLCMLGVNIDARQLELCRSLAPRATNSMTWLQADALALPLADGSVDRLLCIEAMFHFASRRRFFAEAARVLAPGGRLVASDIVLRPTGEETPDAALAQQLDDGFGPWPDPWCREGDPVALAATAGLRLLSCTNAALATRPSHAVTAPPAGTARDAGGRAAAALAALHHAERLAYPLMAFARVAG